MNWLLLVVIAIFILGVLLGMAKGFFRLGITVISAILTITLVSLLTPYVSAAVIKWTPLDEIIQDKCAKMFLPSISLDELSGVDLSGTPLAGYSTEDLGNVNLGDLGLGIEEISTLLGDLPKDAQIKLVEEAKIPEFMKDSILENNNSEIYKELCVTTFPEYVAAYVADTIINLVAFLITLLFVSILVKALMAAVDLISYLPVVHGLNRMAGGVLGIGFALLLVWIFMLVLTLFYATEFGTQCFAMIGESSFLTFLYTKNPLLGILLPM